MEKLSKALEVRIGEESENIISDKISKRKSGMANLEKALELRKAKYLKRTGSPGHYKYVYKVGGKMKITGKGTKRAGTAKPDFSKKIVIPKGLKASYDDLDKDSQVDIDRAIRAGWKPNVRKLHGEAWDVLADLITHDHDAFLEDWIEGTSEEDKEVFEDMGMTLEEAFDEMTAGDIMADLYPEKIPPEMILNDVLTAAADEYIEGKKKKK